MSRSNLEPCPDCGALLPQSDGPTHRYIGASAACWAIFSALNNAGEPPLQPGPFNNLLPDAYAAQHPGTPSPQAIQSVAVHVLTLHGVLAMGTAPKNALWLRQRALRRGKQSGKHGRFSWLTPPSFAGTITVAGIVQTPTPAARTAKVKEYVRSVYDLWFRAHSATIDRWYRQYVLPDRI